MFETTREQRREGRLHFETLPLSVGVHAIAVGAVMIAAIWDVRFPQSSPKLYTVYQVGAAPIPPPPPPPPPPRQEDAANTEPPNAHSPAPAPAALAPAIIPDAIPVIESQASAAVTPVVSDVPIGESDGADAGVPGGVDGGEAGGTEGGTPHSTFVDIIEPSASRQQRIYIPRDKPLELYILSKDYPIYPADAVRNNWEDTLVVRYVIGKNGRVREVTIVEPPERPLFAAPTLSAIRTWRFRPRIENGQAKEVEHELTVRFRLVLKTRN